MNTNKFVRIIEAIFMFMLFLLPLQALSAPTTNFVDPPYTVTSSAPDRPASQVPLASSMKFTDIVNLEVSGAAIDSYGYVWSWGFNPDGRVGLDDKDDKGRNISYYGGMKRIPYFVDNNIKVKSLSASYKTMYAITEQNELYSWGLNNVGQVGNGSTKNVFTPQKVSFPNNEKVMLVDASDKVANSSVFAVTESGKVYAWGGSSTDGEFPWFNKSLTEPTEVEDLTNISEKEDGIKKIVVSNGQGYVLTGLKRVYVWGSAAGGTQGTGTTAGSNKTPIRIPFFNDKPVKDISSGWKHTMVLTEDNSVYEFGWIYGKGRNALTITSTPIPFEYDFSSAEYIPIPQQIESSAYAGYIIDQYGRTWVSGTNIYYSFMTDGSLYGSKPTTTPYDYKEPSKGKLNDYLEKATQLPKSLGDGDTQYQRGDLKAPVFSKAPKSLATTNYTLDHYEFQGKWSWIDSTYTAKHPTIYDKKYYKTVGEKDNFKPNSDLLNIPGRKKAHEKVYMIDKEGNRLVYVIRKDSEDTISGNFYVADTSYNGSWYVNNYKTFDLPTGVTEKTSVPEVKDSEQTWIGLSTDGEANDFTGTQHAELGYVTKISSYQSSTLILDSSGNLYKSGLDGSGAIAWGWDYDPIYDPQTNVNGDIQGLYDTYAYELMFMRGAPRTIKGHLNISAPKQKHYLSQNAEDKVDLKMSLGAAYNDPQLNITIEPVLNETKYIVMPYDEDDANMKKTEPTREEFDNAFNNANSMGYKAVDLAEKNGWKGYVQELGQPVKEFSDDSLRIKENCVVWAMVETTSYGAKPTIIKRQVYDNFYKDSDIKQEGINSKDKTQKVYPERADNIVKLTDDGIKGKFGFPLDKNGKIIGTPDTQPTFGYDKVKVSKLTTEQEKEINPNFDKLWSFTKPQTDVKTYTLNGINGTNINDISKNTGELPVGDKFTHQFFYERNERGFAKIDYYGVNEEGRQLGPFTMENEVVEKGGEFRRKPQVIKDVSGDDMVVVGFFVVDKRLQEPEDFPIDTSKVQPLNNNGEAYFNLPFDDLFGTRKSVVFVYKLRPRLGKIHVRQVVQESHSQLSLPRWGYFTLNPAKIADDKWEYKDERHNLYAYSQTEVDKADYLSYDISLEDKNYFGYGLTSILPQYYDYVGYKISDTTGDYNSQNIQKGKDIKLDYNIKREYWVTIYIKPTTKNPDNYMWGTKTNDFNKVYYPSSGT